MWSVKLLLKGEKSMKIQSITLNNPCKPKFSGYRNLSAEILKSDRGGLINLAEYFHTASEAELNQITRSDKTALKVLKEAIDGVITRKKCYIADGASFAKERAEALDKKAASRTDYFMEA